MKWKTTIRIKIKKIKNKKKTFLKNLKKNRFKWISLDFMGFHWISLDFIGFHILPTKIRAKK